MAQLLLVLNGIRAQDRAWRGCHFYAREGAVVVISLKPHHLKRYKDIARLFMRFGRSDIVRNLGLEPLLEETGDANNSHRTAKAEELAEELERMGPLYVKLGQILSTRADLLPPSYLKALSRLQDRVEPFPFAAVQEIIATELGVRISKAFAEFEEKPIAAASLGQVHKARLRDGRAVAVKVQRPGIRQSLAQDFEALIEIAEFLDHHTETGRRYHFLATVEEFRRNLTRELDYRQEARNMVVIGANLAGFPRILVPSPIEDFTTSRVLTMDYVHGKKITTLSPLAAVERNGFDYAEMLFEAYLKQILVDGVFHADPHPGNVFMTDGGQIALLDLGMVGQIPPMMQDRLIKLLLDVSEGRGEDAALQAMRLGQIEYGFNEQEFRRGMIDLVARQQHTTMVDLDVGRVMLEITRISAQSGIRVPRELTMLGKTLLNLDEVGRCLNPDFNPNESIRRNAARLLNQQMFKSLTPGNLFNALSETREVIQNLPGQVGRIMENIASNRVRIEIDAIDEVSLIEAFHKIANRITVGLILAALIIGAALTTRVSTGHQIFGYPPLAIIFFLLAAGGGVWLILTILINDRNVKHKSRKH